MKLQETLDRRQFLRGAGIGAAGLAGAALLGCGNETSPTQDNGQTSSPTRKTPETLVQKEGVLSLGDWQLEVQEWTEQPFTIDSFHSREAFIGQSEYRVETAEDGKSLKVYREGWKFVIIKGRSRNVGKSLSQLPKFDAINFVSKNGDSYPIGGVSLPGESIRVPNSYLAAPDFPPGLSEGFALGGWIPQIQNDYSVSNYSSRVERGEITESSPILSPDAKIDDISKPFDISSWGSVTFSNDFFSQQGSYDHSEKKYQTDIYARLHIKNVTGQDIRTDNLNLLIFLKNGKKYVAGFQSILVPPGLTKPQEFVLAGPDIDFESFKESTSGGIFTTIYNGEPKGWITWQLPTK